MIGIVVRECRQPQRVLNALAIASLRVDVATLKPYIGCRAGILSREQILERGTANEMVCAALGLVNLLHGNRLATHREGRGRDGSPARAPVLPVAVKRARCVGTLRACRSWLRWWRGLEQVSDDGEGGEGGGFRPQDGESYRNGYIAFGLGGRQFAFSPAAFGAD